MNKSFLFVLLMLILSSFTFGIEILGVSNVDYISNDNDVAGNAFLLTAVAGFDKTGKILASQLDTTEGKATKDFIISITDEKYSCDYSFVNKNVNSIKTYRMGADTFWLSNSCFTDTVLANNEQVVGYFLGTGQLKFRCIVATPAFNVGAISDAQENFEMSFEATNNEEQISSAPISSSGVSSATLKNQVGNKLAYVKWAGGGLKTTESCPSASTLDYIAIQNVANTNTFTLLDDGYYNDYKNLVSQLEDRIELENSLAEVEAKIAEINNLIQYLPTTNNLVDATGKSYTLKDISGSSRKRIEITNPFTLPLFTLKINADYVGIVQNVGLPEIISVNNLEIQSGVGKYADIVIKNIGAAEGTFRTTASCTGNIFATSDVSDFSKGQTRTIKLFFNSNTVVETTESCTITSFDISKSANKDTATLSVSTKPVLSFEDGFMTCFGSDLVTYENNQPKSINCPDGCEVLESGKAQCKPKENTNGTTDEEKFNLPLLIFTLVISIGLTTWSAISLRNFGEGSKYITIFKIVLLIAMFVALFIGIPQIVKIIVDWFTNLFSFGF